MPAQFSVPSLFFQLLMLMITLSSLPLHAKDGFSMPAPVVTITQPQRLPLSESIEAIGTLQANQSVDITPQVSGRISQLHLVDGGSVKKNQILVQLDSREQNGKIQQINVSLKDQQRKLVYMETLFKHKAISKDKLDAQQAQVDMLAANLTTEKTVLNYYTLSAPFDGVLGFNNISPGTLINGGTVITTLDDIRQMKLDVDLPEAVLSEITSGTLLKARTNAWPGKSFEGKIISINPRINTENLTFTVRAVLNNPAGELRPGMLMTIIIKRPPRTVMSIPARSVLFQGNTRYVYLVNQDNSVEKRLIKTGQTVGDKIIVSEGLSDSDRIVDQGVVKVRAGLKVSILPGTAVSDNMQTTTGRHP